jgi:hypothetical protein
LCAKTSCTPVPETEKGIESSRLSLTTPGSSTSAALGNVSAYGFGSPESDVTQSGGGPKALVASQSKGSVGGITSSKSSPRPAFWEQRPRHGVGLGIGQAGKLSTQPAASSSPETGPCPAIACEKKIGPDATMPAAINKTTQNSFCDRLSINERLIVSILAAGVEPPLVPACWTGCQFKRSAMRHSRRASRVKASTLVRDETAGASRIGRGAGVNAGVA